MKRMAEAIENHNYLYQSHKDVMMHGNWKRTKEITITLNSADVYKGPLILVNKCTPIRAQIPEENLDTISFGIKLQQEASSALRNILSEIDSESQIVCVSGYRTGVEQKRIFTYTLKKHGEIYANTYVAYPDCSEHQTGLAIDLGIASEHINFLTPDFPREGISQKFRETASKYGFIERYPFGKEHITGIGYEPWHFRYVGMPHASLINEFGFTFEEYIDWTKNFQLGDSASENNTFKYKFGTHIYRIGYVKMGKTKKRISIPGNNCIVSGNNMDGFIVTLYGETM